MNTRSVVVAVASVLALSAVSAQASVVLRCGGGTVQTDGFIINAQGEVVFAENSIACNVQQTGLPNPLALTIVDPAAGTTINVGDAAQNVQFFANIANYTAGVDVCRVTVQPPAPAASWPPITLAPVAGVATANLEFAQGLVGGTYNLQLSCERVSNNQQVLVPSVSRQLTVISTVQPTQCSNFPIPAVFQPVIQENFTTAYTPANPSFPLDPLPGTGGFGVQPNQATNFRYWGLSNRILNSQLDRAELKTWRFRPPANTRMQIKKGNTGTAKIAASVSECPGQFTNLPTACRQLQGTIFWSTIPSDANNGWCVLDPAKDYYLSAAAIDLDQLLINGLYVPSESCAGSPCNVENLYQVQNVVQ